MPAKWIKRLFENSADTSSTKKPHEEGVRDVWVEAATDLVRVINESLVLSNNSTNPETKVSRLEVAKAKLQSLQQIAKEHKHIKIVSLREVQRSIAALENEYAEAGYYAKTPEDRRNYRNDVARYAQMGGFEDLIVGYQFLATMQLRTPKRILVCHRELHRSATSPPVITKEQWEGIWCPMTSIPPDDSFASTMASDIGPIPKDGGEYLNFLLEVREAVESADPVESRIDALKQILRKQQWASFVRKLGGRQEIIQRFFPAFIDTLPSLPMAARTAFWEHGLTTPNKILSARDDQILAIKGVGPAKLKKIKEACEKSTSRDDEFVDRVDR